MSFVIGDRVLVEAKIVRVNQDGTVDVFIDDGDQFSTRSVWDLSPDIVHFLEAGAE